MAGAAWDEIKDAALTELPGESILRKFIVNDGGFNAITKLANAAREDFDFAQALMRSSRPENYMPELEPYKEASPLEPMLTLHLQAHKNANVKSASAADLNKGYVFEDHRVKAALNEVVYEIVHADVLGMFRRASRSARRSSPLRHLRFASATPGSSTPLAEPPVPGIGWRRWRAPSKNSLRLLLFQTER